MLDVLFQIDSEAANTYSVDVTEPVVETEDRGKVPIADRIVSVVSMQALSQTEIAQRLGVAQSTVSRAMAKLLADGEIRVGRNGTYIIAD